MRRPALVAGLLAAGLGAVLWAGPRLFDWEARRPRLEALASAGLGRPVYLQGALRLSLLPQPVLEAGRVTVGAPGDPVTVAAGALRLRLALPALLTGRLEPREVVLLDADVVLPWPPVAGPMLRPPAWLTTLDARVEGSRLRLGTVVFERVSARLSTEGPLSALRAEGEFAWRGRGARFAATLGRPGDDGSAPLDLDLAGAGATLSARGALLPEGGFEGRLEAAGDDLSGLLPAPAMPFRAAGRLTAAADLLATGPLDLTLAGAPARGAATLRLAPAPRIDATLQAARLDLEAWVAALRASPEPAAARTLPEGVAVGLDLAAEAATLRGVALRRVRAGLALERDRLTLTDGAALLPGGTAVEISGGSAGDRLELAVRAAGDDLRATLEAWDLAPPGADPARLRRFDARARLVLEPARLAMPELEAALDGARLTGSGTWSWGARPFLGLGLSVDRLDLDGLLPAGGPGALPALARAAPAIDAELRLEAGRLRWGGLEFERAALDAGREAGRLTLRRAAGRLAGADLALSATLPPGLAEGAPALADLVLDLAAPDAAGLVALAPPGLLGEGGAALLAAGPAALRLSGGGPPEALALRVEGEAAGVRIEAAGTVDLSARRGAGRLTLRHPFAPRLLAGLAGPAAAAWLGDGSLALVAAVRAGPDGAAAEPFDLVAGDLRGGGRLDLRLDGPRPRLSGHVAVDRLVLPLPDPAGRAPLGLDRLRAADAALTFEASRATLPGLPPLSALRGGLRVEDGTLALHEVTARLGEGEGGGTLALALTAEGARSPPRVALSAAVADLALGEPPAGRTLGVAGGRVGIEAALSAEGYAPDALLATLAGTVRLALRDGALVGLDLPALAEAARAAAPEAALAGIRAGLAGGRTGFERLGAELVAEAGRLTVRDLALAGPGLGGGEGAALAAAGGLDLRAGTLDLLLRLRPGPEGPPLGLRLRGPAADPRRLPETAGWARWRAERE